MQLLEGTFAGCMHFLSDVTRHLLQVKRYEEQHGSNKSTYWVTFELMWRDFFR